MIYHTDTISTAVRALSESIVAILRRHKIPEKEIEEILEEIGIWFSKKSKKETKND
jgi:hypothetical protein